jgi:thiol-disulfide isomerase/thioredoxin
MRRLRLLAMVALAVQVTAHGEHGEYHDRHEHADHHENDEHKHADHHDHDGLHDHHDTINVDAADWDQTVLADKHVWAIKFYSGMCSACRAFKPEWDAAHELVQGLHWAAVDIDKKANVELAQRYGVLDEGIPNVKLINAADVPLPVVTADVVKAAAVASALREKLASANAVQDDAGFYVGHAKAEL